MFQFPANPIVGQLFTPVAGITYRWNGTAWFLVNLGALSKADADLIYQPLSKPLININPHFLLDQQQEGAVYAVAATTKHLDGWSANPIGGGTINVARIADPNNASAKCLQVQVAIADAALAAGDSYHVWTVLEGFDAAVLQAGQANAKNMTIQFALQAPAGTYSLTVANTAQDRHYTTTVTTPDALEHDYAVTIPMDIIGVWQKDNGIGLYIFFSLGAGANFQEPANNQWVGGTPRLASSLQTNFMAVAGNILWLKRFEVFQGDGAQPVTPQNYAQELEKCQRHYVKSYSQGIAVGANNVEGAVEFSGVPAFQAIPVSFPVEMRAAPPAVNIWGVTGVLNTWRNISANTDVAAQAARDMGTRGFTSGNVNAVAANLMGFHWTANARLS